MALEVPSWGVLWYLNIICSMQEAIQFSSSSWEIRFFEWHTTPHFGPKSVCSGLQLKWNSKHQLAWQRPKYPGEEHVTGATCWWLSKSPQALNRSPTMGKGLETIRRSSHFSRAQTWIPTEHLKPFCEAERFKFQFSTSSPTVIEAKAAEM